MQVHMSHYCLLPGERIHSLVYCGHTVDQDKTSWWRWVLGVDFLTDPNSPLVLKKIVSRWVESTGFCGLRIKVEGKLDDILTSYMGGNWELVLPFSQFVLQQSLCSRILLQAPQSRDPRKRGAAHHTAVRCCARIRTLMPFKHLHTARESRLSPAKDQWKETTEQVARIKGSIYTSSVPLRLWRVSRQYKNYNYQSVANRSAPKPEWCTQNSIFNYSLV